MNERQLRTPLSTNPIHVRIRNCPGIRRLDQWVTCYLKRFSRSTVQEWIVRGDVRVNQHRVRSSRRLQCGDQITIQLPSLSDAPVGPLQELDILYLDRLMVAINKPTGMAVHPVGRFRHSTVWGILALYPGFTVPPYTVHRIDRPTSGVLLFARTRQTAADLSRQFRNRTVVKRYLALVHHAPVHAEGRVDLPVPAPLRRDRKASLQRAETKYKVLRTGKGMSLLQVEPLTGRRHQIRFQLAAIGHPIVGDSRYGGISCNTMTRPALHASELLLHHPQSRTPIRFSAPPPDDFMKCMESLS